jgi:hypothetical protein
VSKKTIDEATRELSPQHRRIIEMVSMVPDGPSHAHDLAFTSELLINLMAAFEQTPTCWAIVTAHKALIKMAANEGIIDEPPRVRHPRVKRPVELTFEHQKMRADALDKALVELRRRTDTEVFALRVENQGLRVDIETLEDGKRKLEEELAARAKIACHPGSKCDRWPECERCGPPRL